MNTETQTGEIAKKNKNLIANKDKMKKSTSFLLALYIITSILGIVHVICNVLSLPTLRVFVNPVVATQFWIAASRNILPFFIIADGALLLSYFKSKTMKKANAKRIALTIFSVFSVLLSLYSLIVFFLVIFNRRDESVIFNVICKDGFNIWMNAVFPFSAFCFSCASMSSAIALKRRDIDGYNILNVLFLGLEVIGIVLITVISIVYTIGFEVIIAAIVLLISIFTLASILKTIVGNKILRNAVIGGIVAGPAGSIVAAIATSKGEESKK